MDALEVMFAERARLETVIRGCSMIETIDDVDMIEQYLKGLHQTNAVRIKRINLIVSKRRNCAII